MKEQNSFRNGMIRESWNRKGYIRWLGLLLGLSLAIAQTVFDGFTLFDPIGNDDVYMMDNELSILHTWQGAGNAASMSYLLPDSTLLRPSRAESIALYSGGAGGRVQKLAWDNSVIFTYYFSDSTHQQHHDIEPLPNGNFLLLAWEHKDMAEAIAMGRQQIVNDIWPEVILEIQPMDTVSFIIVWEWHLWDHVLQDTDNSLPGYGVIGNHPELLDINFGSVGLQDPENGDWIHANAIDYHPGLDQIVFCSRKSGEFYIIDHSTTTQEAASHSGGLSGKGGDFLYRWGNPQVYEQGAAADKRLFAPHGVNWIPENYPDAGSLLIFNNGSNRPGGNYSSVEMIVPPTDGNAGYLYSPDEAYLPAESQIIYADPGNWYSNRQSGAYRLANGNTLITSAYESRIFEITDEEDIIWEYIHPGDLVIARSEKYSWNYLVSQLPSGDINQDGVLDILDIVSLVNFIMETVIPTDMEFWEGDINQDAQLDIIDIIQIINLILL